MNQTLKQQSLFEPLKVGTLNLSHRIVMAPLTRLRSTEGDVPGDLMVEYYKQRASNGGLIITESTEITPLGSTYPGTPGIYNGDQINGWKKVTDAVHQKKGYIFLQLFHGGRTSHPDNLPGAVAPVAPSSILANGVAFTPTGPKPFAMPRALLIEEIPSIVELYKTAAINAISAGFDGVEILGGGGYLLDEFLQDGTNKRTDKYGGAIENRARLLLEVTAALTKKLGGARVGLRINPNGKFNEMSDSTPEATFGYVAEQINQFNLAYLHVVEPRIKGSEEIGEGLPPIASVQLRKIYKGTLLATGGFDPVSAASIVEFGNADMVAFGRNFIANPDLPHRIKFTLPLNKYERSTFYGGGAEGYTDYPFHVNEA